MDSNKLREEMRTLADSICDVIDAVKKFDKNMEGIEEISPELKIVIAESLKTMTVKLMYGEKAYAVSNYTRYARRDNYPKYHVRNYNIETDEIEIEEEK